MLQDLKKQLSQPKPEDFYFMNLAIEEAKKGVFTTKPNPVVGCLIVKDGLIIGKGFHPKAGKPHAEVYAIRDALAHGCDVVNATAYVTLEPCSHTGRTAPCADALIAGCVSRVVIAMLDPNPKVCGNGIKKLIDAGIEVVLGVAQEQSQQLNPGFLKAMSCGMPYVRLKTAMSIDGKIAMSNGESQWITGASAREDVQRLRALSSAIITGSGTVIADNPLLNVRSDKLGIDFNEYTQPKVVILDRSGKVLKNSQYYQILSRDDCLVWAKGIQELLDVLVSEYQCYDVLVEAGSGVSGAFINEGLVDELIIYQAPCILGSHSQSAFDFSISQINQQKRFRLHSVERLGEDVKMVFLKS